MRPGQIERQAYDDNAERDHGRVRRPQDRHRQVVQSRTPRHRHQEFLAFLKQVAKAYPRRHLHMVCDTYATHKHPAMTAWLVKTPTSTCTSPRPAAPG